MPTQPLEANQPRPAAPDSPRPVVLQRPVLLVIAYACHPAGLAAASEQTEQESDSAGAAWQHVLHAAREFDVHVVVSAKSLAAIERAHSPLPSGVRVHTPREDAALRLLQRLPRLSDGGLAYRYWQRLAFRQARVLHRLHCLSLVHQLHRKGLRTPGYASRLGIPFLWGPVDTDRSFPLAFLAGLPLAERLRERALGLCYGQTGLPRRTMRAGRAAAVLLAADPHSQRELEHLFHRPVELVPQTTVAAVRPADPAKFSEPGPLRILWQGDLIARSALPLLLEALANLGLDVAFELHVLGQGPCAAEWQRMAQSLGMARRCTFVSNEPNKSSNPGTSISGQAATGHLAHGLPEDEARFQWAQLYVSTRLVGPENGDVLTAMSRGLPVVCFHTRGVEQMVTPACGILIPVTHPGHAIAALASSIQALATDRARLAAFSAAASARARSYLSPEQAQRTNSLYRRLALAGTPRQIKVPRPRERWEGAMELSS